MAGGEGRGRSPSEDDVDHYAVLGLPSGEEGSKLSLKEIEKAYRNQSRIRHPDKRPDDPNATADFQLLTSSFEVLRDEMARSCFDAKLRSKRERVLRDSFQDAKRQKMATDLEERERSAAAFVDPAEEVRRKEKMKSDELKREIAEFKARRAKKTSESVFQQYKPKGEQPSWKIEQIPSLFEDTDKNNKGWKHSRSNKFPKESHLAVFTKLQFNLSKGKFDKVDHMEHPGSVINDQSRAFTTITKENNNNEEHTVLQENWDISATCKDSTPHFYVESLPEPENDAGARCRPPRKPPECHSKPPSSLPRRRRFRSCVRI